MSLLRENPGFVNEIMALDSVGKNPVDLML